MARAATTTDAFNAIAEPHRRAIVDALGAGERPVNDLVAAVGLTQPQVSKHLRVLREAGVVTARDQGRSRLYRINPDSLKAIHDWVSPFQRLWEERYAALDDVLEDLKRSEGETP
jgi:DNA-binding transcriptional ArsR family regulator